MMKGGEGCARRVFDHAAGGGRRSRRGGGRGGPGGAGERAAEPDGRHVHHHRGRLGRGHGRGQAGGGGGRGPGAASQPGAEGRPPARGDRGTHRQGRGRRAPPAAVTVSMPLPPPSSPPSGTAGWGTMSTLRLSPGAPGIHAPPLRSLAALDLYSCNRLGPEMEPLRAEDPRRIGRYRLVARLGAGGMGRVFLGFSPAGRPMAVKVVYPELARDRAFINRFRQEVAAARRVSGAYTAPVVDAGDDEPPWLATTLVMGPSLDDTVDQQGPLAEIAVWRLAEALAEVHACGLVHRDLKPSNVLLAADGPRVIDFGISRALDGTGMTGTGVL